MISSQKILKRNRERGSGSGRVVKKIGPHTHTQMIDLRNILVVEVGKKGST